MATLQILGALMVLAAFVLSQARHLTTHTTAYLLLNAVGAGILTADALRGHQWGFPLLEGTWCLVALRYLLPRALTALAHADGHRR